MSKKKKIKPPDGPYPEVPAKLYNEVKNAKNDEITEQVKQQLRAFCDLKTFVSLDGFDVPVLCPNVGFMPISDGSEFMDFDYMVEVIGLRKYVRTKFEEEHFRSTHVAVAVVGPGLRSRQPANLFLLDSN